MSGTADNPYRYSGYLFDEETGLYYLKSRYYDPETARFLQEDTYRGQSSDPLSLNLYAYVKYNPLKYSDPTGHWEQGDELLPGWVQTQIKTLMDMYYKAEASGDTAMMNKTHQMAQDFRTTYAVESSPANITPQGQAITSAIASSTYSDAGGSYMTADMYNNAKSQPISQTYGDEPTLGSNNTGNVSKNTNKVEDTIANNENSGPQIEIIKPKENIQTYDNVKPSYIFYDPTYDFMISDAKDILKKLQKKYSGYIYLIPVSDSKDFIKYWNEYMGYIDGEEVDIGEVVLIFHGDDISISFGSEGYNFLESYDIQTNKLLKQKNIETLLLGSCDTGNLDTPTNLAKTFAQYINIKEVIAFDGIIVYSSPKLLDLYPIPFTEKDFRLKPESADFFSGQASFYEHAKSLEVNGKNIKRSPMGEVHYIKNKNGDVIATDKNGNIITNNLIYKNGKVQYEVKK